MKTDIISWLDSLPIYDSSSWEGLHHRYGHDAHVSARVPSIEQQSHRGMTPHFYIPPSNWWRNQARTIMHEAFVRKIHPSMILSGFPTTTWRRMPGHLRIYLSQIAYPLLLHNITPISYYSQQ